jgi:hypothetical protein
MKCLLTRKTDDGKQTTGELEVIENNVVTFSCKTLELPWKDNKQELSCIPTGTYTVVRHISPRWGTCFWVKDVPGRTHILFHAGNYAGSKNPKTGTPDTLGCILPGVGFSDFDGDGLVEVTSSGNTMKKLLQILPDEFELKIISEF